MERDGAFTPGWYVTTDGMDMLCFDGDMWRCPNLEGEPIPFADGDLGTMEWDVVRRTFSESSFPLRRVCPRMPPSAGRRRIRPQSTEGEDPAASATRRDGTLRELVDWLAAEADKEWEAAKEGSGDGYSGFAAYTRTIERCQDMLGYSGDTTGGDSVEDDGRVR